MVVRIPAHALTLGKDPVFRGEWRGEDVLYAREDFLSGVIPDGLITWQGPGGGTASVVPSTALTWATTVPPYPAGGAALVRLAANVTTSGAPATFADINIGALDLPEGLQVTKLELHYGWAGTTAGPAGRMGLSLLVAPGASSLVVRNHGTLRDGSAGAASLNTAGLSTSSVFRFWWDTTTGAVNPYAYFTLLKVYGTLVPAYRFGAAVSWRGKVWQSVAQANNDEPGTTERWLDLTPQVPAVPKVSNLGDVDQAVSLTDGMVLRYSAASQKGVPTVL